jgi:hypothetical protein
VLTASADPAHPTARHARGLGNVRTRSTSEAERSALVLLTRRRAWTPISLKRRKTSPVLKVSGSGPLRSATRFPALLGRLRSARVGSDGKSSGRWQGRGTR